MGSLIDTDLLFDGLHDSGNGLVLLERLAPSGLSVSIISLGELFEGAYRLAEPEPHLSKLRAFLSGYRVLSLSEQIMNRFARERAALRSRGLLIPDFDLLIAATALTYGLDLVTRNTRHFTRIPGLQLIP